MGTKLSKLSSFSRAIAARLLCFDGRVNSNAVDWPSLGKCWRFVDDFGVEWLVAGEGRSSVPVGKWGDGTVTVSQAGKTQLV